MQIFFAGATLPRKSKRSVGNIIQALYPTVFWCESEFTSRLPPTISLTFTELQHNEKEAAFDAIIEKIIQHNSLIFVNSNRSIQSVSSILESRGIPYELLTKVCS